MLHLFGKEVMWVSPFFFFLQFPVIGCVLVCKMVYLLLKLKIDVKE